MGMVDALISDGTCPICHRRFKSHDCPHSLTEVRKVVEVRGLQRDLESSTRKIVREEIQKQLNSNVSFFVCNDCGLVYAFDLKQIKKHGLKEVGDRHCICGGDIILPMGDTQ